MSKGDTVGSREIYILTKRQEQILLGTLLGDGFLEQNGKNVRLKIDHGAKQKAYVFWLYEEFKTIARQPYQLMFQDKRTGKTYEHWRFATLSLPLLSYWRKLFYHNGRKIISPKVFELIDPLSLAVWYMDDGFRRKDCRGIYLCTSAYSMEEQNILQICLKKKFNIQTRLHFAASQVRIYIPSSCVTMFCSIIKPFMLPSFTYKLFDPVTTDSLAN